MAGLLGMCSLTGVMMTILSALAGLADLAAVLLAPVCREEAIEVSAHGDGVLVRIGRDVVWFTADEARKIWEVAQCPK